MDCLALVTRPGRAAAAVVTVGLLFGLHGVLTLARPQVDHAWGALRIAELGVSVAALGAACIAVGVFRPLHSRSGDISLWILRAGLVLGLVPVVVSDAAPWDAALLLAVPGIGIAAVGTAGLVLARRHEGDLPGRLLELTLIGTLVGVVFASVGGCLVPGVLWCVVAAVLWITYVVPGTARTPLAT